MTELAGRSSPSARTSPTIPTMVRGFRFPSILPNSTVWPMGSRFGHAPSPWSWFRSSLSGSPAPLLITKSDHGIHTQRSAGRDVTRPERHGHEQKRHGEKSGRVGGTDAVDHAGHEARQRESRDQTKQQAEPGQTKTLCENELQ